MKINMYLIALGLMMMSCGQQASNDEVEENTAVEEENQAVEVKTDTSTAGIQCTGTVDVAPKAKISIHSKVNGIVTDIAVMAGQKVKKGQVLARIEHPEILKLQEDYLKAKADYHYWNEEFKRKTELYNQGITPKKEYQSTESEFNNKKAAYESLGQQLELVGISKSAVEENGIVRSVPVRSSVDGFVVDVYVNTGMFASQDTRLFDIVNADSKFISLNIYSTDIGKVKEGQEVSFHVAGSDKQYKAEVSLIGKMVSMAKKSVTVIAKPIGNTDDLVVGSSVFAEIR